MPRKKAPARSALRGDTTLAPAGGSGGEVYVRGLPRCCLKSFKEAVVRGDGGRIEEHRCPGCGRGWVVAGSLDEKVMVRFVVRGGTGESGSAA